MKSFTELFLEGRARDVELWYHGNTEEVGRSIARTGYMEPVNRVPKKGLNPMENRVYMGSFKEALEYAFFRSRSHHRDSDDHLNRSIVEIRKSHMKDFDVDEDTIADALCHHQCFADRGGITKIESDYENDEVKKDKMKKDYELGRMLLPFITGNISRTYEKACRLGDYEYFTQLGKSIIRKLSKNPEKYAHYINRLEDHTEKIAHRGKVLVNRVFIFSKDLKQDNVDSIEKLEENSEILIPDHQLEFRIQ